MREEDVTLHFMFGAIQTLPPWFMMGAIKAESPWNAGYKHSKVYNSAARSERALGIIALTPSTS